MYMNINISIDIWPPLLRNIATVIKCVRDERRCTMLGIQIFHYRLQRKSHACNCSHYWCTKQTCTFLYKAILIHILHILLYVHRHAQRHSNKVFFLTKTDTKAKNKYHRRFISISWIYNLPYIADIWQTICTLGDIQWGLFWLLALRLTEKEKHVWQWWKHNAPWC